MNANEPVAWYYENKNGVSWVSGTREKHDKNFVAVEKPIYTHPADLTDEVYFCSRCGKRLGDGIHTCTPPADILRKAQEK